MEKKARICLTSREQNDTLCWELVKTNRKVLGKYTLPGTKLEIIVS